MLFNGFIMIGFSIERGGRSSNREIEDLPRRDVERSSKREYVERSSPRYKDDRSSAREYERSSPNNALLSAARDIERLDAPP